MSRRVVIAVDLDDTLAALTPAVVQYASKILGVAMAPGDITDVAYWDRYGVSDSAAIRIVHSYNEAGFPNLYPISGAYETLQQLAGRYDLHVLTSRDPISEAATKAWLTIQFPNIFASVRCLGNPYVSNKVLSKADACLEIGAETIIDDGVSHVADCIQRGVANALLFGDYPWNEKQIPDGAQRVADWAAVRRFFDEQS